MMRREHRAPSDTDDAGDPGRFGCPMLAPVHWERAAEAGAATRRCLIGWSLGDELAVARCRATHAVTDCWKAHPERTPMVALDPLSAVEPSLYRAAAD